MLEQKMVFKSGNELAAIAAKQINYHVMGYYPITPSTQIAENLDLMYSEGEHNIRLIPAEGEHSAAGICYGASTAGARVFNATSANGLLYSLEQLPVQSGTRFPMILNVACRSISGPLSIKGDHSDIMYALNSGWIILFAKSPQEVYDFNIIALKLAETVMLPVIVAFDGFFTSHQKRCACIFKNDSDVKNFIGEYKPKYTSLDTDNPITIGSYMNEPDLLNNKYQLHLAMEKAEKALYEIYEKYCLIAGRRHHICEGYLVKDAEVILFILGSSFDTAKDAVDLLRQDGLKVGVVTISSLRPWCGRHIYDMVKNAKVIVSCDRQASYGECGGNLSTELKSTLQGNCSNIKVISRIYGIGGRDFYVEDAKELLMEGIRLMDGEIVKNFDYFGKYKGSEKEEIQYFNPVNEKNATLGITKAVYDEESNSINVTGGNTRDITKMPDRLAPGHGACPGCGIPVNIKLLLSGIEGNVVLLFHTGCGMVVTTSYPKTSFKVNYIHNLFQNGAPTLSGVVQAFHEMRKRNEIPDKDITFVMVSGDGGLDIGLGAALGTAFRNEKLIIFEYDNGGYMNTGYQQSYSTPKGARSATSHIGPFEYGKKTFHKDNPQLFAASNIPYVATVAESHISDFVKKAAKAQKYANEFGTAYIKALSACPLNWNDNPRYEREVIESAVKCCYHPLYEVEQGITKISFNPEEKNQKIPVSEWFKKMGRTKHLIKDDYKEIVNEIQNEIDRRWERLKAKNNSDVL